MIKSDKKYILEGELSVTLQKRTFQALIQKHLDKDMPEEQKQKFSYYIAGDLFQSERGIDHLLALGFGEEIVPLHKIGQHVVVKHGKDEHPGIIMDFNEFKNVAYSVNKSYISGGEVTDWNVEVKGNSLKAITESVYFEMLQELVYETTATKKKSND